MCTVILGWRLTEATPLVLAANRDERYSRPSAPPGRWDDLPIPVMAPRDLEAGGTWLGINAKGVLAALTNRFGHPRVDRRRSRGELVLAALAHSDARIAADQLAALAPELYNPFNLLIADGRAGDLLWHDGTTIHRRALLPGWLVLTERSLTEHRPARETWLTQEISHLSLATTKVQDLAPLLATHGTQDSFERPCVHFSPLGYGTRSSTLIARGGDPAKARFLHAEGPPCTNAYRDLSAELVALLDKSAAPDSLSARVR